MLNCETFGHRFLPVMVGCTFVPSCPYWLNVFDVESRAITTADAKDHKGARGTP